MTDRTFARGFLPETDPLAHLPEPFVEWEALGVELSKLLFNDHLRPRVLAMPPFPVATLDSEAAYWRAASLLAYLTSLYLLGVEGPPLQRIPAVLAEPFCQVANHLGVPPILSYGLQALVNW